MLRKPLVSVITPTYNRPKKITKAIDTVVNQSYSNLEHIIVDGNSDYSVDNIVSTHLSKVGSDLDTTVEIQSENKGLCAARNRGMELADGQYFAFLDDDDEWYSEKIARQVDLAERSGAGIIYTGVEQMEGNDIFATQIPNLRGHCTETLLTGYGLKTPSSIMISEDIFNQTGGFDPDIEYFEDVDFFLRASRHTTIDGVDEVLVTRHHHDSQMTEDYQSIIESVQSLIPKHRGLARQYGVEKEYEAMWEGILGGSAVSASEYKAARRHYFRAARKNLSKGILIRLVALSAGGATYRPLQNFRRRVVSIL